MASLKSSAIYSYFTVVAFAAPYKVMIGGVILSVVCVTLIVLGFSAMSSGFPPAKYFLVAWGLSWSVSYFTLLRPVASYRLQP